MNYIAHLHIAHHTHTSMIGSFLGDFIKGSDLSCYPRDIEIGIRLHRSVDRFTDAHQTYKSLAQLFPRKIKRMAPIAIDIFFDHLLVKHWSAYSAQQVGYFLLPFYQELEHTDYPQNRRFTSVQESLLSRPWLQDYQHVQTVLTAMRSIERRIKGNCEFAECAFEVFRDKTLTFEQVFAAFYPDLLAFSVSAANAITANRQPIYPTP